MLFINTRPVDRAASLTMALEQQAVEVYPLPLLELLPREWDHDLARLYQQLAHTQVIVVVSPSAVQFGMAHLLQSGLTVSDLQHIQWIAVGQKTAQALAEYGLDSVVPEVETSEGMLQLPVLQNLASDASIAFWRGEGGRQFMMDTLMQHGRLILNFVLYERHCPNETMQQQAELIQCLSEYNHYVALISSEASWLNWLALLDTNIQLLQQGHFLVLGERLAQILKQYQQQMHVPFKMSVLKDLKTATIVQLLQSEQGNA